MEFKYAYRFLYMDFVFSPLWDHVWISCEAARDYMMTMLQSQDEGREASASCLQHQATIDPAQRADRSEGYFYRKFWLGMGFR